MNYLIVCKDGHTRCMHISQDMRFKIWIRMKLMILAFVLFIAQASATVHSQTISLYMKDAPLEKVLEEVKKQSSYSFISSGKLLKQADKVSVQLSGADLQTALSVIFKDQPLTYTISGQLITVKRKTTLDPSKNKIEINQYEDPETKDLVIEGRVIDAETGEPVEGAVIEPLGFSVVGQTDKSGNFRIVISFRKEMEK